MSNNHGPPPWSRSDAQPFIVATYAGISAAIRRTRDYARTILSITRAFEELRFAPVDRIRISAKFSGYEQDIRITEDMWADLLPSVSEVIVTVTEAVVTPASQGRSMITRQLARPLRTVPQTPARSPPSTSNNIRVPGASSGNLGASLTSVYNASPFAGPVPSVPGYEHIGSCTKNPALLITARYLGQAVKVFRDGYYPIILLVRTAFRTLQWAPSRSFELWARPPGYQEDIRITEEMWGEVEPTIQEFTAVVPDSSLRVCDWRLGNGIVFVRTDTGKNLSIKVDPSDDVDYARAIILDLGWGPMSEQRLMFAGKQMEDGRTLGYYGVQGESTLHLHMRLRGGKPVVYLFPPMPKKDVRVHLSLVKAWKFSALYPLTPVRSALDSAQSVTWTINAKPDGTLFDHGTGREVSYLFWEAHTNPAPPLSPGASRPSSPVQDVIQPFDPSRPVITPANSVVLPFDKVTGYIDDVLLSLGLHTEARCSFITYWLPDLQNHGHIALRFLPQAEYEAAAPMSVTPAPDVTTRVFMLFRGVEEADLSLWAKATKDVNAWKEIVGVDVEKVSDTKIFRVLEWGGMELK